MFSSIRKNSTAYTFLLLSTLLALTACGGGGGGLNPALVPPGGNNADGNGNSSSGDGEPIAFDVEVTGVGHINFESPHADPIALHLASSLVCTVNTPADTVDIIDTATSTIV